MARAHVPAFGDAVADLGTVSSGDIGRRSAELVAYLPRLWATAEAIVACGHAWRASDVGGPRTGPSQHNR